MHHRQGDLSIYNRFTRPGLWHVDIAACHRIIAGCHGRIVDLDSESIPAFGVTLR